MANILGDDKKHQILALVRLGWPLRRIEQATGVRRETASTYLKAAGIVIREHSPNKKQSRSRCAQSQSVDVSWLFPSSLTPRSYTLLSVVDPLNKQQENSETNNVGVGPNFDLRWIFGTIPGQPAQRISS
jgi:hypothetical protein